MNNLIHWIAEWLTTTHSIALTGWVWLLVVPIAVLIIGAVFAFIGYCFLALGVARGLNW